MSRVRDKNTKPDVLPSTTVQTTIPRINPSANGFPEAPPHETLIRTVRKMRKRVDGTERRGEGRGPRREEKGKRNPASGHFTEALPKIPRDPDPGENMWNRGCRGPPEAAEAD